MPDGVKQPLLMFVLVLLVLCVASYFGGKGMFGYVRSTLAASIITFRWSDRDAMPRWLYWALLLPIVVLIAVVAYFFWQFAVPEDVSGQADCWEGNRGSVTWPP